MTVQETGKVFTSAIDAFKGNPACLASILLAGLFALLTYFSLTNERAETHEKTIEIVKILNLCMQSAITDRNNE